MWLKHAPLDNLVNFLLSSFLTLITSASFSPLSSIGAFSLGLPRWLSGKESTCQCRDTGLIPGQEDPLEEEMATCPVFLPGESHTPKRLADYSPRGNKRIGHNWVTGHACTYSLVPGIRVWIYIRDNKLWEILKEMEIPDHLTFLLRNLYTH